MPRSSSSSSMAIFNPRVPSSSSSKSSQYSASSSLSWGKKVLKLPLPSPANNSSSRHSDLTEERLEAFNKSGPSPYYKGLTDYSLDISRQQRAPGSPGRESHATTAATSSSIISNLSIKIQTWISGCFTAKTSARTPEEEEEEEEEGEEAEEDIKLVVEQTKPPASNSPSSPKSIAFVTKDESCSLGLDKDDDVAVSIINEEEKPLRERVSEVEAEVEEVPAPIISRKRVSFVENDNENAKDKAFIWADKYRPKTLPDFICNRHKALQLMDLVKVEQPHRFIFEGFPGVGKKTMISAFLREVFGHDGVQTREECKKFYLKGESIGSIRVNVKISSHHIELNLSELKGYEKHVIVQLIQETCDNKAKAVLNDHDKSYAIVLYEVEKLSTEALLYFKWLLDKYEGCNMIFSCSDVSKLQPIKPLCRVVQLLPPSDEEIVEVLKFIAIKESIKLPQELADKIVGNSKNNLRQAIRSFEATWMFNYPFEENQEIRTGWEDDIARIAKNIIEEQSPKQLYNIRGKLQKLIEHNVASEFIHKTLVGELKKQLDCSSLQFQFDSIFEDFYREDGGVVETDSPFVQIRHEETGKRLNDPMRKNAHDMLKIEESIAKFMSCYKSQFVNNQGRR